MKKFRCYNLHKLVKEPKKKGEVLTETAKSEIIAIVKQDLFGFHSFTGNAQTKKGVILENEAITLSGQKRYQHFQKHVGRAENDFITGECDILDRANKRILDIKCSWDIGTHPFWEFKAIEKAKESGYDWQMQAYMWLYDCEIAEVDFWLLPCPHEVLNQYDDKEQLIDLVNNIDLFDRVTTVRYQRDEKMIARIQEIIPHCQAFYNQLTERFKK